MSLSPLLTKYTNVKSSLINYRTARWRRVRKPFWVGIAKSKLFKIPVEIKKYSKDEFKEFIKLERDYNSHRKSLMKFIRQDDPRLASVITSDKQILVDLETQIQESLKKNDLWNAECASNREKRIKEVTTAGLNKILQKVEQIQEKEKTIMERIEEVVKIEKALSQTYITPENIDEAIDKCLKNVVEYDFAIDLKGNKYYGRETLDKRAKKSNQVEADATG